MAANYSIFLLNNLLNATDNGIPEKTCDLEQHPEWEKWNIPELEIFSNEEEKKDERLTSPEISCYKIVQRLMNHCFATNRNAATFMQENPTKKLPKDYKLYPGKMDHTTCLCIRVQKNGKLGSSNHKKEEKLSKKKRYKRKLSSSYSGNIANSKEKFELPPVIYPSLEEADTGKHFITAKRTSSNIRKEKKVLLPVLRRSRSLESIPLVTKVEIEENINEKDNN